MIRQNNNKKIALVHDWLVNVGGAEKVLRALHQIFPEAPIYVLFRDQKFTDVFLPDADVRVSFLQKYFQYLHGYKFLIPFLPLAVESLDLSEFDLVMSTSSFAKGLILKPKTTHINYCPSPTRQVWDWWSEYKQEKRKMPMWFVALFQHIIRIWDTHASKRVDYFLTYSKTTQKRIEKYYNTVADIIYPPVTYDGRQLNLFNLETFSNKINNEGFFLIVSRLFRHKNVHLAVKAFNKLGWPLIVIGDGPELSRLTSIAKHNVRFLGFQPDDIVDGYYSACSGFIMPQEEDFGLTPLEAMHHGKPVLALKRGGALEYIKEGVNGEFFEDPCEEMLADGVRRLKENICRYSPELIKKTTEQFSFDHFRSEFIDHVNKLCPQK